MSGTYLFMYAQETTVSVLGSTTAALAVHANFGRRQRQPQQQEQEGNTNASTSF